MVGGFKQHGFKKDVPKSIMVGGPSNMGPKRLPPPKLPKINEKINGGDNAIKCQEPIVTEVP